MKSISRTLLFFCVITLGVAGAAERNPTSDIDMLKHSTDQFMTALSKGQVSDAFNTIFKQYWYDKDKASRQKHDQIRLCPKI
jgi:hypothetical protein